MTTINKFSTDSGIVGDNITNDSTLTLTGTATADSTVRVYDGATQIGTATANSSGAWSYTTGAMSNGTHSFTAATTSTSAPSSGFPDASTTGVPPGTTLTSVNGNFTSSYAGQIIDGLDVNGQITVNHPGVIVRNVEAQNIVVRAEGCTIEDSTFVGRNDGGSGIVLLGAAYWPSGAENTTVRRCDVSGVENGIWLEANGCLIADNYIHDLRNDVYHDPHYDGLQIPGGAGVSNNLITHNNFDLAATGMTASITMSDATNIDITNNRLHGGAYNIYFEGNTTGCDVTNNVFAAGVFGEVAGKTWQSQTYSGNVYGDTAAGTSTTSATTTDTSPTLVVTVDTTAPTAPTIATPTNNANGGLNLTGAAEANSVVAVYDGTTQIGTATANSSGAWSHNTGTLATGSHSLTAKATDAAGNTSAASAVVTAGTGTSTTPAPAPTAPSAPTIASFSNDSGAAGDKVTSDSTLTLTGSAAANSTVKMFDGTTQIGTATANGSGAWTYTTAALSDGNHSLTATATTSSGTSAASSALGVTIDTKAPTAPTIATPTTNANGGLNLTGTAEANSVVKVHDGTTEIGTATANNNGAWSYATGDLADGSHSLTARATDAAGNTGAASSVVTASTGDPSTPTPSPTPTPPTNPTSPSSGFPDASTTGVPAGTSLTTADLDEYGNFTSSYAGQIIDARDVNGTIIVNHPGVIIRNCEAQYISVKADNVTIEDTTVTGQNMGGCGIGLGGDNATVRRCDISGVDKGIWLQANDSLIADNYIHDVGNNGLQIPGSAWTSGVGVSNSLITHNNFDLATNVNASITMSDATNIDITNNRLHGGAYTVYFQGNTTGCDVTNNVFAGGYFGDIAGTAEASQTYSGNVHGDGATSTASATTTDANTPPVVTVDTAAPAAPHIGSNTSDGGTTVGGTSQSLDAATTGTTDVDDSTLDGTAEANNTVNVLDGTTQTGTTTTNSSGTTPSNLADSSHSSNSSAADAAGDVSSPSSEAPTVEFTNARQTWNDNVVFRGTADPNDLITIHDHDGTAVGTARAGGDGTFRLTTSSAVSDDVVHRFTATIADGTGQSAPSSSGVVLGRSGDDQLTSTSGNDLFRGNGGHDTFDFAANFGQDVITDFGSGRRSHDVVEFSKTVFDDFADVLSHASQSGRDVVIDAGDGNALTLKNTALSSLDRSDFHFA